MFFVLFWTALVRYTWLSNSSRFFSDNQYFRMFLVSMADIIGSYERSRRCENNIVQTVAAAQGFLSRSDGNRREQWRTMADIINSVDRALDIRCGAGGCRREATWIERVSYMRHMRHMCNSLVAPLCRDHLARWKTKKTKRKRLQRHKPFPSHLSHFHSISTLISIEFPMNFCLQRELLGHWPSRPRNQEPKAQLHRRTFAKLWFSRVFESIKINC